MLNRIPEARWSQLSEVIARTMGLNFPRERWDDLQRGLSSASQEFGFDDAAACVDWLTTAPLTKTQLEVLASHLTVGETYFFRDQKMLAALAEHVLPGLIRARRGRERRLRIWSAGCCTGEEPYTLAMLLHQLLPDLPDWHVTITATDINGRFLHKAAAGVYGDWSFRDAPAGIRERYFSRTAQGRFAIAPEIRKLVRYAHLNLAEDVYPSLATDTNALDLIFCRNVLMYFTPTQVRRVIGNLRHALVDGGWLVVSPSEASHALFPQFVTVNFPGVVLYQTSGGKPHAGPPRVWTPPGGGAASGAPAIETLSPWPPQAPAASPAVPARAAAAPAYAEPPTAPRAAAEQLYQQGRYAEAADTLAASFARQAPDSRAYSLLARALANQGRLADALASCDRWIAADKLDPAGHYLRAVVLLEQGDDERSRVSLQRALFLDPDFVLAHFALGNLARSGGRFEEADRHFANALHLLRRCQPDDLLPESDSLTAGRLTETLAAIIDAEPAP